jgi:hypothetical protein
MLIEKIVFFLHIYRRCEINKFEFDKRRIYYTIFCKKNVKLLKFSGKRVAKYMTRASCGGIFKIHEGYKIGYVVVF